METENQKKKEPEETSRMGVHPVVALGLFVTFGLYSTIGFGVYL